MTDRAEITIERTLDGCAFELGPEELTFLGTLAMLGVKLVDGELPPSSLAAMIDRNLEGRKGMPEPWRVEFIDHYVQVLNYRLLAAQPGYAVSETDREYVRNGDAAELGKTLDPALAVRVGQALTRAVELIAGSEVTRLNLE